MESDTNTEIDPKDPSQLTPEHLKAVQEQTREAREANGTYAINAASEETRQQVDELFAAPDVSASAIDMHDPSPDDGWTNDRDLAGK